MMFLVPDNCSRCQKKVKAPRLLTIKTMHFLCKKCVTEIERFAKSKVNDKDIIWEKGGERI